ncbi:hypothetical protein AgCh_040128 [Apium graveolens]
MIKEKTNSEATKSEYKAKSQVEVDPSFKGKAKVDEPVKVYMPIMDLEDLVNYDMTMKQETSDRAQVGLISEDKGKETSDIAHVRPSKILLPGFTKAQQSTQPLKTTSSGF